MRFVAHRHAMHSSAREKPGSPADCACDIPEDQESVLDCLRPLIEEHYWTEFNAYPQDIRPVSGALTKL